MGPSKLSVGFYPAWMRYVCVLLHACCFPGLMVASCLGAGIPWGFAVISAVLSERALAIVARPNRQNGGPVYRLVTAMVQARFPDAGNRRTMIEPVRHLSGGKTEESCATISE